MANEDLPVRTPDRFLVFGAPDIGEAEIEEVVASLRSGWLGTGPKVARFERDFAAFKGAPHAAAVSSCTAALHLSMVATGIGPGDEVITSALTFCATINAIIHAGGTPVVVDVEPESMNLDPEQVAAHITPRTKAVVPVHFSGRPCDMASLVPLAREHGMWLIEDCAHAVEAEFEGRPVGTFGDFGCFSFYVTKNVITGEGGMVLARQEEHANRITVLALHGLSKDAWKRFSDDGYRHYHVTEAGFKYNMMDIQAALGIHQLQRVLVNHRRRAQIWWRYRKELASLPVGLPAPPAKNTRHAHHLFPILIDETVTGISRDNFLEAMTREGIGVGVHYLGLPEHPYYRDRFGWRPEDVPHATRIGRQTVSLPLSSALTDADVDSVIEAVKKILP